ncbi:MAG TPA: alpha/beta hydrolase [Geodermatophilus sp.]|nr:alpha/beta hydrolase [Geodermatophilus sp.]
MSVPAPRPVLVPGLGLDGRSSAGLRARVDADVVHLPGMGLAAPVPSVDALAARLCARLGPGPVVLVGHSQSCQVVVAAAQRDRRVVALVLLGPTTDPRLRSLPVLAWRWLRTAVSEPIGHVPRILAQWAGTGPRAMVALWRSAAPDRIDARLRRIGVPVTVVRGTRDRLCPHDWAAGLVATSAAGRLVELPGAAHMTVQTRPDDVAAVLQEVLAEVSHGPLTGRA